MTRLALLVAFGSTLTAQVQVGMAPLAYALDETSRTLRPLVGTPGSAYLGEPLALPFAIRQAELRGAAGVLLSDTGVAWRVTALASATPELSELGPATQVWSDDTATLAVLRESAVVIRLAGHPAVTLPAPVAAVTFLARCALVAAASDEGSTIYRLCPDRPSEAQPLRTLPGFTVSALAAAPRSGLFAADRARRQLGQLREPFEASSWEPWTVEGDAAPVALVAMDAGEVLVAFANTPRLLALPSREAMELPAPADRLIALASGRLIACSAATEEQPLLLLDLLQDRTAFFIPMPPPRGASQ